MSTKPFVVSTSTHHIHLINPLATPDGSPLKIRNQSSSPEKRNKSGIKVTTMQKPVLELSSFTSDDALHEVDPLAFANRCSKVDVFHYNIDNHSKTPTKTNSSYEKELFEKLKTTEKVRLTKRLENKEESVKNPKSIKFTLEDVDENLDLIPNDDEGFHLGCLSFEVSANTSVLDVGIKKSRRKNTQENGGRAHFEFSHEFELGSIALLRNKFVEIRLSKESGGTQTLGKIEYRLRKFRIYDQKGKLLYKIHRQQSLDPKMQIMSIRDSQDIECESLIITHLSSLVSKCEIAFPEKFDSMKKLLFISTLLFIMERVEVDPEVFDEPSPPKTFLNSIFEFLTCQS